MANPIGAALRRVRAGHHKLAWADPDLQAPQNFQLTSPSFGHGATRPFSDETLLAVGPRKADQSLPAVRVPRSSGSFSSRGSAPQLRRSKHEREARRRMG